MDETLSCTTPGIPRAPIFHGDYSFNTGRLKYFSTADYVIFTATIGISAFIGFYQTWRSKLNMSLDMYLTAERSMSAIPVGLTLLVSYLSAATLMDNPKEMYYNGTEWLWVNVSFFFTMAATAHIYIPVFYQLKVSTVFEYLEMRFSRGVRIIAAIFYVFTAVWYLSVVTFWPNIAIQDATGINMQGPVSVIGLIVILYTALGGMKAVVYTCNFQMVVMFIGVLALLIQAAVKVGGWGNMWDSAERTNRVDFLDFQVDPRVRKTVWNLVFGGILTYMNQYATSQVQIHRCLACKTLKDAKIAVWMNFPGLVFFFTIPCFIGLYMAAFYENCDPEKAYLISNDRELLPLFAMDVLSDVAGLPGLFSAALFSGSMSSVSTGLHSIAAVLVGDFVKLYFNDFVSESRERLSMQIITVVFGVACLEFATLTLNLDNAVTLFVAFQGIFLSPLFAVFSLGMFFPWTNNQGAMIGLLGSTIVTGLFAIWNIVNVVESPPAGVKRCVSNCNLTVLTKYAKKVLDDATTAAPVSADQGNVFNVSYMWYPVISVTLCLVIGLVASKCTGGKDPKDVDPRLIVPLCDIVFPFYYLPESTRERWRCGINHEGKFASKSASAFAVMPIPEEPLHITPSEQVEDKPTNTWEQESPSLTSVIQASLLTESVQNSMTESAV